MAFSGSDAGRSTGPALAASTASAASPLPHVPRPRRFVIVGGLGAVSGGRRGAHVRRWRPPTSSPRPDLFGAKALSRSAILGKAVGLKRGAVRFAKGVCPSLLADPTRRITRVRLLGGPVGAPLVVGKSLANGTHRRAHARWAPRRGSPPAIGKTRQAHLGRRGAVTGRRRIRDGGLRDRGSDRRARQGRRRQNRAPGFRVDGRPREQSRASAPSSSPSPSRPSCRRRGSASRASAPSASWSRRLFPVDLMALRDLVAATPLTTVTRHRLELHARHGAERSSTAAARIAPRATCERSRSRSPSGARPRSPRRSPSA